MEFERLRGDLLYALGNQDLQTIKQLCRTHPDLLKSIDENGNTPLHEHLRISYPTLEIVTFLIQHGSSVTLQNKEGNTPLHEYLRFTNASLEIVTCLIQHGSSVTLQNKEGNTPLHVFLSYPLATLKIVNLLIQHSSLVTLQNKNGNTPLHEYLWNNYPTLEIVTCLIQYGSSVTSQNEEGNTPMSLLENNRRIRYQQKTKILNFLKNLPSTVDEQFQTQFEKQTSEEQKTTLLKPESDIPSDIAARELEFQDAYNEALKGGSVKVNLGMLKVIGQEGVGKTCLINACLGKIFEEKHKVTDGIAVIRTVSTTWKEAKADSGNPSKQYTKMVTDKLRAKKTVNINMKPPTEDDDDDDDDCMVVDYNNDDNKDDYKNVYKNDGTDTATEAIPIDTDQPLDKDVIKKLEENKEETLEETFNIWDHGGQLIYHGIHRMFMTLQALYIVVFDLSVDLDEPAIYIDANGKKCKHHWTNLQFILSYILSVYSHSRIVEEDEENEVHKPTILIVGTHKGKLGETEKEQNDETKKAFKKIRDALKQKEFITHVYNIYFAVENSQETTDKSFIDLKKVIDDLMTALEKEVPLKWMRFRCDLHDLRRKKHFSLCPVEELKMLASKNGIADEKQQSFLLNFLYDLGEIVYRPDNKLLKDKAVLDPMQLVEIVTTFVTVVPPEFPPAMYIDAFDKLDKGILEEKLLRKLWKKRKVDDGKNFEFLVALMIQLGFICERKTTSSQDVESVGMRSFFVPLRLAFKTSSEVKPVSDDSQSISIYYDFKGYLPDVLFPYMIIDFLNKFQKNGVDPILSYNHAELYFNQDHHVTLSLVKFVTMEDERKFLLKVTIKRTPACNETSNDEPSSEACKEVLLTIQKSFEPTKDGGRRGIKFERCILCGVCSDTSEKKHIQNLGDFQDEKLTCTKTGKSVTMDVKRYKLLFGDDGVGASRSNQEIPEDDFQQLLNDTSEWFDRLGSLGMLKVLYKDHMKKSNVEVERAKSVWDLLQFLRASGNLSPSNLTILYDTIKITEQFGFKSTVKNQPPEDIKDHVVSMLTSFRQKIYQLGLEIRKDDVSTLARLFNEKPTLVKKYQDSWSLISDFEHRGIIDKDFTKMVKFMNILDKNGMEKARRIFYDDL